MELFAKLNFDFIGKRNIALVFSLILISAGLISIGVQGGLKYGIDFSGGTLIQMKFANTVTAEEVRAAITVKGLGAFTIQRIGDPSENEILIKLSKAVETKVEDTPAVLITADLENAFGQENFEIRRTESVGPTMGEELKKSAVGAVTGALIMILLYITFRFQFKFGIGALAALIHDVLITVGIFSLTGREFNLPVVAALLTIVGYSLNDTIVVYDRIRENQRIMHRDKLISVINTSINQTLSRTMLTSLTTLVVVSCLFFLGGEVINDFSFALLIGIIVGTYSSIFVASPVLVWWNMLMGPKPKKAGAK